MTDLVSALLCHPSSSLLTYAHAHYLLSLLITRMRAPFSSLRRWFSVLRASKSRNSQFSGGVARWKRIFDPTSLVHLLQSVSRVGLDRRSITDSLGCFGRSERSGSTVGWLVVDEEDSAVLVVVVVGEGGGHDGDGRVTCFQLGVNVQFHRVRYVREIGYSADVRSSEHPPPKTWLTRDYQTGIEQNTSGFWFPSISIIVTLHNMTKK